MQIGLGLIGQLCFEVMSQDSLFQNDGLGFSLHWTATSLRMAIWTISGTLSFPLGYGDYLIFQDDSVPCHNANVVKHWKSDQDMRCLEWLPQSPELNPIENVWRDLGEAVRSAICHNLNELHQGYLVIEWSQIPVRRFQRPTEYGQLYRPEEYTQNIDFLCNWHSNIYNIHYW